MKDKNKFDKIFIFNSSLRFNLIARMANIKEIFQYPLFKKDKQHIINSARDLIKKNLNTEIHNSPEIQIDNYLAEEAKSKFNIDKDDLNND